MQTMTQRIVLEITGADRVSFLQGLVTNDVDRPTGSIVYSALLTPQGKYLADFFVIVEAERLLLDVAESRAASLLQRLNMYRLRADVQIMETDIPVARGTGSMPNGALNDPRHDALGWRSYIEGAVSDETDYHALRVVHMIPETGIELTPETYILEAGFEALNGVDFKKGCFVGQEIVSRMKHKTTLKKGLARVAIDGAAAPGDPITADNKPVGTLHTVAGNQGLAYLRFDRAVSVMQAGDATLTRIDN